MSPATVGGGFHVPFPAAQFTADASMTGHCPLLKFVTFSEDDDKTVIYTEYYHDQLYELYHGVSGSIYKCLPNETICLTHIKGVYNSDIAVPIEKETDIWDVFQSIVNNEKLGKLRPKDMISFLSMKKQ